MSAPRYKLNAPAFIAPHYLKEGTEITYDGPFGPHMEPLNAEAEAKAEAYFKANPGASLNPIESLPLTLEVHEPEKPSGPAHMDLTSSLAGVGLREPTSVAKR